ncbi:MAG: DUF3194 domain-containing protein [Halobacteriaceae archaeon]
MTTADGGDDPDAETAAVDAAARAAERVIFSRLDEADVVDYDVRVSLEDGRLDVDVYLERTPDGPDDDVLDAVADDAALAAGAAADDVLSE